MLQSCSNAEVSFTRGTISQLLVHHIAWEKKKLDVFVYSPEPEGEKKKVPTLTVVSFHTKDPLWNNDTTGVEDKMFKGPD